jgi:hypothetical protein
MAITVLSGTSGALYYKPAGTTGTFGTTGVNTAADEITIEPYLNLRVGDPVQFSLVNSQTGALVLAPACWHRCCNHLFRHCIHGCHRRNGGIRYPWWRQYRHHG